MSSSNLLSAAVLLRPGIADGFYPERPAVQTPWLQKMSHSLAGMLKAGDISTRQFGQTIRAINHYGKLIENYDEAELTRTAGDLRSQLHKQGMTTDLTHRCFALVRETAHRTINMRHFDCQLMGGWVMVHGQLAEMETGEGKTLTATLAAATAALAGIPVHVVTVNDYLVNRDVETMGPIYRALGLSVAAVTADMDEPARRAGYSCDIAYCTNKQLAFDYLRDRILLGNDQGRLRLQLEKLHEQNARTGRLFLRGLCFAIVDEADSVLIDEARTPLIISRKRNSTEEEQSYRQAVALAAKLEAGRHFSIDQKARMVELNDEGKAHLAATAPSLGTVWKSARQRHELVHQALSAHYLYIRDRHYLVQDDKVKIIDENTGRVMPDRSWERGLHQMIEIKEDCKITGQQEHLARMTYQRFFRRYLRLAGMTGTAQEVKQELWSVYHLTVTRIATNRPTRRVESGRYIFADKTAKWSAIVTRIRMLQEKGRPVLVGTRSVSDSELLSDLLQEKGIEHRVLNARQDAHEAAIISGAGQKSSVTVATNMAGRGTDIPLGAGVAEIGGLHVISTEFNEARRIDRQLYGRCGRQGDPGSYESLLCLEDELLYNYLAPAVRSVLKKTIYLDISLTRRLCLSAMRLTQYARERQNLRRRRDLLQMDEQLGKMLAFSGRME